ncbi:MAG: hypothetical protein KJO91_11160 [Gammaproteobacteria bacterium]|nr:hypothetical protein [Gammaproteobacteria bacterium]
MGTKTLFALLVFAFTSATSAGPGSKQMNTEVESSIEKLDSINHLPNLLPVILENRDFIGLTEEQFAELDHWRNENREPMLAAMKEIARKRVAIRQAAISPTVSSARLQQMQNEIFRLQREVLNYKLSCRDHIVKTFNNENWISFFMVLAEQDIGVSLPADYAEK